jgi:ABC-type bacteriocin/lantibiotic exporter with double-glycine peptidase domain
LYKFFLKNKIFKTGKNTLSISGYLKRVILITISAIKEIKIYGREKKLENLFNNYFINLQKNNLKYVMYNLLPKLTLELYGIFLFFLFFLFLLSKHEVYDVLPIISLYIIAFIRLLPSTSKILNSLQSVEFHKPHFKILIDEFKHYFSHNRGSKKNETNPLLLDNQKFFIELKNVNSEYDGKKILNDINLKIYKNKIILIKGESGSGKTTLVDIISGLVKPSKGECNLVVNNKKISLFNNFNFLRQFLSLTPQKVILFNETIKENILFGNQNIKLSSPQYSQFKNVFKYSDLENFYKKNKKRKVGFMGSSISGGQIQRIGISRTLFKNRNIMIFDEPTSSLNYEISTKIYKHLNTIKLEKIIIIISHDNNIDKYCDEVYVLKNAKLTKKLN